jgi:hypothetical protein
MCLGGNPERRNDVGVANVAQALKLLMSLSAMRSHYNW